MQFNPARNKFIAEQLNSHLLTSKVLKDELVKAIDLSKFKELPNWKFTTDSRSQEKQTWFIALKGEKFDGHKFCKQALDNGASGLIVSNLETYEEFKNNIPTVLVKDTLKAYQVIANYHIQTISPIRIAITGSNGKTGTKELLKTVLEEKYKVTATYANENNEIGVAKTLLKAEIETEVIIIEMGMRGLGEIKELTEIADPTYSIVTNIGTAHIGRLGSRENIAHAKSELFRFQSRGHAFIPFNEPLLDKYKADYPKMDLNKERMRTVQLKEFGDYQLLSTNNGITKFSYKEEQYSLSTTHQGILQNCCAVIDLAKTLHLEHAQIQKGLNKYKPTKGRGETLKHPSGALFIDETYNANPDSVEAMLKSIKVSYPANFKIAIIGEMHEIDGFEDELFEKLAKEITSTMDCTILIGSKLKPLAKHLIKDQYQFCESPELAYDFIKNNSHKYLKENVVIGFKASRSVGLENLINKLQESK